MRDMIPGDVIAGVIGQMKGGQNQLYRSGIGEWIAPFFAGGNALGLQSKNDFADIAVGACQDANRGMLR